MTGLSAVKAIYKILSNDSDIKKLVGTRIYPVVAEETSTFPFIAIKRDQCAGNDDNDGVSNDSVVVKISVATSKYGIGIDTVEAIRKALDGLRSPDIASCYMTSSSEDFMNNTTYLEEMYFTIIM